MILELVYDNNSTCLFLELEKYLQDKEVSLKAYNMSVYKDSKKGFKIKGGYSARLNPFALLKTDDNKVKKAFYSESGDCNTNNILKYIQNEY